MPTAVRTSGEEYPNRALTPATAAAASSSATSDNSADTPGVSHGSRRPAPAARDHARDGPRTPSGDARLHHEEAVQPGRLEQAQVARGDLGEDDAAPGAPGPPVCADEHAEPGRVPDLQLADVQEEVAFSLVDAGVQGFADRGRRPGVEPADEVDLCPGPG